MLGGRSCFAQKVLVVVWSAGASDIQYACFQQ